MSKQLSGIFMVILWVLSITSCLRGEDPMKNISSTEMASNIETNNSNTEVASNIETANSITEMASNIETVNSSTETVNNPVENSSIDPLLLCYFHDVPTFKVDTSANVVRRRIGYRNFEQKDIIYGDAPHGTENYNIYLFRDGVFHGADIVTVYQDEIMRSKAIENVHNPDGTITVNLYEFGTNKISYQHIFTWNDNILTANQGNRDGRPTSVVIKNDTGYLYFSNHRSYGFNLPDTEVQFNNNETIIYSKNFATGETSKISFYEDGILMKVIYRNGRTETYTVSSGTGEKITTDNETGNVIERARLERIVNEDGYLVYELLVRQSGGGYEYFYTKDTFGP